MKCDLNGKVALVTGAAGGIGRAVAAALAASGARLVCADIQLAAATESAAELPGAFAARMDVSDEASVAAAMEDVLARTGRLDILVNNAGVNTAAENRVNIDAFPLAEWERVLRVDLTGLYLVSRAAVPLLQKSAGGARIINISSVLGLVPARLQCAFVAAKAGVVNLTRAMAMELAPMGILTNCVAPGSIITEGTGGLFYRKEARFNGRMQELLDHIPLGRPGTAEEVAHAVCFLAAPESSYINGAVLPVDGGWLAGYIRDF
jgi:NAD(P)-dependent dehydrogenase (short-subunit alcohol dehydrogenase family)